MPPAIAVFVGMSLVAQADYTPKAPEPAPPPDSGHTSAVPAELLANKLFFPHAELAYDAKPWRVNDFEMVGHIGGPTWSIAVDEPGQILYRAEGPTVVALDVSEPTAIREIGRTEPLSGIVFELAMGDGILYVAASEAGLAVIDIADPHRPTVIGQVRLPAPARGVAEANGHAYVAASEAGLRVVDMADPRHPREVAALEVPGVSWTVAHSEGYVYLWDAPWKWPSEPARIIDVHDPGHPQEVGTLPASADYGALSVDIDDDHLYAVFCTNCLDIFDISVPTSPRRLDCDLYDIDTEVIDVSGGYAYIASMDSFRRSFTVLDVSEPANPVVLGTYGDKLGLPRDIAILGDHVFVAGDYNRNYHGRSEGFLTAVGPITVVDVSDRRTLRTAAFYSGPLDLMGGEQLMSMKLFPAASGTLLSQTEADAGRWPLRHLDIAEPARPHPSEAFDLSRRIVDYVEPGRGYALTYSEADGSAALEIVDPTIRFSEPLGSVPISGRPQALALTSNERRAVALAREVDGSEQDYRSLLQIADVSDATAPVLQGVSTLLDCYGMDVATAGHYAYVTCTDPGQLRVLDIREPTRIPEVAVLRLGDSQYTGDIAVDGAYAYTVVDDGFAVINVADPTRPLVVGHGGEEIAPRGYRPSLHVSRGYAFFINDRVGAYELADPMDPNLTALFESPSHVSDNVLDSTWATAIVGEHLFVTYHTYSAPQGIMVLRAMASGDRD